MLQNKTKKFSIVHKHIHQYFNDKHQYKKLNITYNCTIEKKGFLIKSLSSSIDKSILISTKSITNG